MVTPLLGTVSVLGTIGVATFSSELEKKNLLKPVAYIAAVSTGLITHFSLQRKASDARTAWRILRESLIKSEASSIVFSDEQLIDAYSNAESILGHIIFTPPLQPDISKLGKASKLVITPPKTQVKFDGKVQLKISPAQEFTAELNPKLGKILIKDSIIEYSAPSQNAVPSNQTVIVTVKSKDNQEAIAILEIVK